MLNKTDKGREELRPGQRTLGQRERAVLLLIDGRQPESAIEALFGGQGRQLIQGLIEGGYVQRHPGSATPSGASAPHRPVAHAHPRPARGTTNDPHGDAFAGPRSLASARMFLFDISERMFSRRDPAMARRYREALRLAREPDEMLTVGRELVTDIKAVAGPSRADGISERLARLLPESVLQAAN